MKVEAIKVENGFLIPLNEILGKINQDKILLDIEIIEPNKLSDFANPIERMLPSIIMQSFMN